MLQIDKRRVSFVIRSALIYNNFHSSPSQSSHNRLGSAIKLEQVKTLPQQKFTVLQESERERGRGSEVWQHWQCSAIKLYGQSA